MDWCTAWPDSLAGLDWSHCCAVHDVAYLMQFPRIESDLRLGACVAKTGAQVMGLVMSVGLALFGGAAYKMKRRRSKYL